MPKKRPPPPTLSLMFSHPPAGCSYLGTLRRNPALWTSTCCKMVCDRYVRAETRWCRSGQVWTIGWGGESWWAKYVCARVCVCWECACIILTVRLASEGNLLEIWVCLRLKHCLFQASLYFTHEVHQRELIGGRQMKLGQRTHQVFTKRNFSSFTVLSWKRPIPKLAHL